MGVTRRTATSDLPGALPFAPPSPGPTTTSSTTTATTTTTTSTLTVQDTHTMPVPAYLPSTPKPNRQNQNTAQRPTSASSSSGSQYSAEPADGAERPAASGSSSYSNSNANGNANGGGGGGGNGAYYAHSTAYPNLRALSRTRGGGGSEEDDDDEKRRRGRGRGKSEPEPEPSSTEDESEQESEQEDDDDDFHTAISRVSKRSAETNGRGHDYGNGNGNGNGTAAQVQQVQKPPPPPLPHHQHHDRQRARERSADDDVPLARQIPGALRAQRTIRRQVKDELDQRKAAKAVSAVAAVSASTSANGVQRRTTSAANPPSRDLGAVGVAQAQGAAESPMRVGRPRTRTMPSQARAMPSSLAPSGSGSGSGFGLSSAVPGPIPVQDLTRKLVGLQMNSNNIANGSPGASTDHRSLRPSLDLGSGRTAAQGMNGMNGGGGGLMIPHDSPGTPLRPMRSFHRPTGHTTSGSIEALRAPPLPQTLPVPLNNTLGGASSLLRKPTRSRRPSQDARAPTPLSGAGTGTTSAAVSRPPDERSRPQTSTRPPSTDREGQQQQPSRSRRPSVERHRVSVEHGSASVRPSRGTTENIPPAPVHAQSPPQQPSSSAKGRETLWQQRVFIGTMQRFCLVEIGTSSSAGEVLRIVESQGALEGGGSTGGWMLWEVSQDFGMERPVRSFEVLSDICESWNSDKIVNLLVIKKTLLAPLLSRTAIPSSSPVCSGYVQWEYKRGKWQKRWLELREHSLWLSKRDGAKDSTFLCSLTNFDAYYVTRVHKAPKPYVFAVKSTDSLTFFENTSDYVHLFSCGEGEGKNWVEKVLLARSYVMYQERNVLTSSAIAGTGAAASGLARASTRKQPPGQRPAQPLVNVSAPKSDVPATAVSFEPRSLLAMRRTS